MAAVARLLTRYEQEMRVFPTIAARLGLAAVVAVVVLLPYWLSADWLQTMSIAGCFAVAAISLNLLTGYTGQVSLGQAFFLAVGGYTVAHIGHDSHIGVLGWLLLAAVVGAAVGTAIGPFALRLQGNYLAIVTIALLFVSSYLWNRWTWFTGGGSGIQPNPPLTIGPINFADLHQVGFDHREQGVVWLIWLVVAVVAILAKNLVRGRPGRAMQAVRDRDLAAEAIGVSLTRYKVGAFAVSSAFAAMAGALYFDVVLRSITPEQVTGAQGLFLSVQFVAAIIIGGLGTIYGGILGALFISLVPEITRRFGTYLPFIGDDKLFTVNSFNNLLFGALIVVFLIIEPYGLAALWRRIKAYFSTWPFSY
jgi:branched-chain amino acid transport system permease protein